MKGSWVAAPAAFLLLAAACAPPVNHTGNVVLVSPTPTPSPSPTPTTAFAASGPGFHAGEVGIAFGAVALTASGGVKPYHWTVATGSLPPGLTLGADGTVTGSPTAAGHYTFTIHAADSGDSTAAIPGAIDVAAALSASLTSSCARYCNVELGCVNACGGFGQQSGGVAPFAYALTSGQLPAGTSLSGLSLKGTFTGLTGYLQFTVQVTDALGATASVSPTFWMYPHLGLSNVTCSSGAPRLGTKCSVTLTYAGGTPAQSVALAPTGWTPGSCSFAAFIPCGQPAFAVSYQPGQAVATLTYGANYPATHGTLAVRLTSSDLCGPATSCTADAAITVNG